MFSARQWCAILPGVLSIATALWSIVMNKRAQGWPTVQGRVLRSRLVESYDSSPDADIRYSYQVQGVDYESSNIGYGGHWGSQDPKLVAKYPVGATVSVYVNPAKPSQAALERAPSWVWLAFMGAGAVFIAVGVMFM